MAEPFLAEIRMMSFGFAPKGWTQCNGQFLPINQNQALFSLLGTQFGGNGQTTFALPDLRGPFPLDFGPDAGLQARFNDYQTLTVTEMPLQTHIPTPTNALDP